MSSPPQLALSPPYAGNFNLPKKRPAGSTSGPSNTKRRKPSTSSSSHPLRQTSFPPPEGPVPGSRAASFSPSISESFNGGVARSIAGSSSVTVRGKRGRKGTTDARSNTGTAATGPGGVGFQADDAGSVSTRRGRKRQESVDDEGEKENEEDSLNQDAVMEEGKENEAKMIVEKTRMLMSAFNEDQMERYDRWRQVKLNKAVVKKLANQTLSQSITDTCYIVLNGCSKAFIGELIERAKDVQTEWLAASPTLPTGEPKLKTKTPIVNTLGNTIEVKKEETAGGVEDNSKEKSGDRETTVDEFIPTPRSCYMVEEKDRGPLTTDHLREALRRYKKDRDGGGAAMQGVSLQGKIDLAARTGGRKLFR